MNAASVDGRVMVRVGDVQVARDSGQLVTIGLGSCVAVALYDAHARVGGLAHVMLPDPARARKDVPPARFASPAVDMLLELMQESGAQKKRISARLIGGAAMFPGVLTAEVGNMGERNVASCRAALERNGIGITHEEVGGSHGRSVFFDVASGAVRVTTVLMGDVVL
jgi:chemotaxis protein CheD